MTIYYRPTDPRRSVLEDWGHLFIYVRDDETGESAYFDYFPENGFSVLGAVDQARIDAHASLTIETTARQEQAILKGILAKQKKLPEWKLRVATAILGLGSTCVTQSLELLRRGEITLSGYDPEGVWKDAYMEFSDVYLCWKQNPTYETWFGWSVAVFHQGAGYSRPQAGTEYGRDPHHQARRLDPKAINNQAMYFKNGKRIR